MAPHVEHHYQIIIIIILKPVNLCSSMMTQCLKHVIIQSLIGPTRGEFTDRGRHSGYVVLLGIEPRTACMVDVINAKPQNNKKEVQIIFV